MGYTTEFDGQVEIVPPLNPHEISYLNDFANSRRMKRTKGPYYVKGGGFMGQDHDDDIQDFNSSGTQPGLWCQWVPTAEGEALEWNGTEKFYDSAEWMVYLVDHFLKPGATVSTIETTVDSRFSRFTFDHVCNGVIDAQGESSADRWRIVVKDNVVSVKQAKIVWDED